MPVTSKLRCLQQEQRPALHHEFRFQHAMATGERSCCHHRLRWQPWSPCCYSHTSQRAGNCNDHESHPWRAVQLRFWGLESQCLRRPLLRRLRSHRQRALEHLRRRHRIDFRAPYVGFSPNAASFETVGTSAYDALETHLEKRLSHNYQVGASYTFSHTYDEQSDIGLFFTGDNPNDLRTSYAPSDFDRTHVFSASFLVNVPNTADPHSFLGYLANDWHLSGIAILQSGQPYSLYEFYGAVGSVYFGNFPTLMNPVLGIKGPKRPYSALTGNSKIPAVWVAASSRPSIPASLTSTISRPARKAFRFRPALIPRTHLRDRLRSWPAQPLPPGSSEEFEYLHAKESHGEGKVQSRIPVQHF